VRRPVWLLLLAVLLSPAATSRAAGFDADLASQVFGAALAFIAPRTLDPTTPAELALWGLRGIAAIDPGLSVELANGHVRLLNGRTEVMAPAAPPLEDATAWGRLAAQVEAAAFAASEPVRRAGQPAMVQAFFDEMFNHLDPYSRYIPPDPATEERDRLSGSAGAGLSLQRVAGVLRVAALSPGGPAARAGVRVGDRLLSIDGHSLRGLGQDRIEALLDAPEGSRLRLVLVGLDGRRRVARVDTALVPPETVDAQRDGDLLVVRVTGFASNTAERLSQVLEAGLVGARTPPSAVVLDLRGNRGGLLRQAVTAVALLADQGLVASTAGRAPGSSHEWRIEGGDLTHGLPVIVLVDGRTASAAEIMAAALADLGRGVVVGSVTLGKGLVQTITPLPDGGELFVTWSRVLAPDGWPIQGLGVMPQVCTSQGEAETRRALDDLAEGKQDMQAALAASRAARAPLPSARIVELRAACPAAEGSERDLAAARFLAAHPAALQAALLHPPVK
jgi:carboxyl-terminal processing protease